MHKAGTYLASATENWKGGVSIGVTTISKLRYTEDTMQLAGDEMDMAEFLGCVKDRVQLTAYYIKMLLNDSR